MWLWALDPEVCKGPTLSAGRERRCEPQGYLAHIIDPPIGPPFGPGHNPIVGSWGGAVSYERGPPVDHKKIRMQNTTTARALDSALQGWSQASGLKRRGGYWTISGSQAHAVGIGSSVRGYRGTSLIRNRRPLGPYRRTMSRALYGFLKGGRLLMSEGGTPAFATQGIGST